MDKFYRLDLPPSANRYWRPASVKTKSGSQYNGLVKTEEAALYLLYVSDYAISEGWEISDGDLFLKIFVWMESWRPDPHNYIKVFLDAIEGHLYKDDKQVMGFLMGSGKDKQNPGIEFQILTYDRLYPSFWDIAIPGTT